MLKKLRKGFLTAITLMLVVSLRVVYYIWNMKIGETLAKRCIKIGVLTALGFITVSCSAKADLPREVTVEVSNGARDFEVTCTAGDPIPVSSFAEGASAGLTITGDPSIVGEVGEWIAPAIEEALATVNGVDSMDELQESTDDVIVPLETCDINPLPTAA